MVDQDIDDLINQAEEDDVEQVGRARLPADSKIKKPRNDRCDEEHERIEWQPDRQRLATLIPDEQDEGNDLRQQNFRRQPVFQEYGNRDPLDAVHHRSIDRQREERYDHREDEEREQFPGKQFLRQVHCSPDQSRKRNRCPKDPYYDFSSTRAFHFDYFPSSATYLASSVHALEVN